MNISLNDMNVCYSWVQVKGHTIDNGSIVETWFDSALIIKPIEKSSALPVDIIRHGCRDETYCLCE